jgi:glycosyltransferase involved in cell wall biosynthesis
VYRQDPSVIQRYYNGVMARADRVIAISEYVAEHIRHRYGVPEERLRVIHRGIDIRRFDPDAVDRLRIEGLAAQWRVRRDAKLVLLPSRGIDSDGERLLLEALAKLPRRDFLCVIVAGSERRAEGAAATKALIGSLELGSVVRPIGPCEDLPAALMLADVVVVPSTAGFDPMSRALEAQAMGRPVVATNVGGLGEALMPAATGWLVEPEAGALAHALELALAMPDEARARLAVRSRRFVTRKFSLERMGDATMQVYRELLDGLDADASLP